MSSGKTRHLSLRFLDWMSILYMCTCICVYMCVCVCVRVCVRVYMRVHFHVRYLFNVCGCRQPDVRDPIRTSTTTHVYSTSQKETSTYIFTNGQLDQLAYDDREGTGTRVDILSYIDPKHRCGRFASDYDNHSRRRPRCTAD